MIVLGGVLLFTFAAYERLVAPRPFIPFHLLTSRTVVGACLLDLTYQIAYYCWASYFTSFLQVVYGVSLTQAGYIGAIFDLVSPVWLLGAGFLMRYTGRFKWMLLAAVPLYMLAVGLLIYFRSPGHSVGYICLCSVLMGVAGGTMILCMQVAVMAASSHNDYAAMLALLSLFGNVGGAVGNSISGAVWTNTLPRQLQHFLPAADLPDWAFIYEDLETQLSYPWGSETRDAIIAAYAVAQRNMLIAGTAVMGLGLIFVVMIKNIKLKDADGMRGVVF
jgi:predicted MFS family arabinose efflux permease